MNSKTLLKVGVLVSGRGSNLQALIDASRAETMAAHIGVVISNKPNVPALEKAQKAAIPTEVIKASQGEERETYDRRVAAVLEKHGVKLVVLAGFMRILSPWFVKKFFGRLINIHPSLLPDFPGLEAQKQALTAGVNVSGCTVHFVDEGCDTGPIILQTKVPVEAGDTAATLEARILKEEHRLLPKAVDLFAKNKVKIVGQKVIIESS